MIPGKRLDIERALTTAAASGIRSVMPYFRLGCSIVLLACAGRWAASAEIAEEYDWTPLPIRGGGYMRYTVVNPKNPDILYAACDVAGVFKSTNGGLRWQAMVEGLDQAKAFSVGSIALDPCNPEIVYAVTAAGLYRSDDGGRQWILWHRGFNVDAGSGLPVGQTARGVT